VVTDCYGSSPRWGAGIADALSSSAANQTFLRRVCAIGVIPNRQLLLEGWMSQRPGTRSPMPLVASSVLGTEAPAPHRRG